MARNSKNPPPNAADQRLRADVNSINFSKASKNCASVCHRRIKIRHCAPTFLKVQHANNNSAYSVAASPMHLKAPARNSARRRHPPSRRGVARAVVEVAARCAARHARKSRVDRPRLCDQTETSPTR